jgi:hypothetical protein
MRVHQAALGIFVTASVIATAFAAPMAGSIPPGKQHRLTIEGESTVTFVPQAGLPEFKIDYQAKIEYIINTRFGKEPRSPQNPKEDSEDEPVEKPIVKKPGSTNPAKAKARKNESPDSKVTGAVDLSLHSSEMSFRQNGQPVMEMKVTRSRFQGRLQPDTPILSVTSNEAPPRLQEILKTFDTVSATMFINDDHKVVNRKFRHEGAQRAVTETILSIHAPIPKNVDSWESPTQLAMGQGQTAKGKLHFEKDKTSAGKSADLIKVKVSGVLKAEGAIAGRFIKDGTYTVTGEQTYDQHNHEWVASRWSVEVNSELANPDGQVVAQAKGTMIVQSKALSDSASPAAESVAPKP